MTDRENEAKLDILNAVARSQTAIARMIESIADVTEQSDPMAVRLRDNIRVMSNYQLAIARKLTGMRIRHMQKGTPSKPWFNVNRRRRKIS